MKRFFFLSIFFIFNGMAMDQHEISRICMPDQYKIFCRYLDKRLRRFLERREKFRYAEHSFEDFTMKMKERERQNKKDRLDLLRYNQLINDKHTKMYKVDRNAKNGKSCDKSRQSVKAKFLGNR